MAWLVLVLVVVAVVVAVVVVVVVVVVRACGDELAHEEMDLSTFDQVQEATLERLVPGLDRESHRQAGLAVQDGRRGHEKGP